MISVTVNAGCKKSRRLAKLEPSATMKLLLALTAKVDMLMNCMQRIIAKLYPEEAYLLRPDGMPGLPLKKERHFAQFESYLEDPSNFSKVVSICHDTFTEWQYK